MAQIFTTQVLGESKNATAPNENFLSQSRKFKKFFKKIRILSFITLSCIFFCLIDLQRI